MTYEEKDAAPEPEANGTAQEEAAPGAENTEKPDTEEAAQPEQPQPEAEAKAKPEGEQPTSEQPAPSPQAASAEAPKTPAPFKATPLEKFTGWFVGAHFDEHYTQRDAHDINVYTPLVIVSAAVGALGVTTALSRYVGVPWPAAFFPTAAAYICLDRALIRSESLAKADAHFIKMQKSFEEPETPEPGFKGFAKRMWKKIPPLERTSPIAFRFAVAGCMATLTGGALMQQMAKSEIDAMIEKSYLTNNKDIINHNAQQKGDYERQINQLRGRLGELQLAISEMRPPEIKITRQPSDQAAYDTATKKITALESEKAAAEKQLITDQKMMEAEATGADVANASGKRGTGKRWDAARINVKADQENIGNINAKISEQKSVIANIDARYEKMMADAQKRAEATEKDSQAARKVEFATGTVTLQQLEKGKVGAFIQFDKEMAQNPKLKKKENDTGPFADMKHLEEFLSSPETGAVAKGYFKVIAGGLILFELLALLSAVYRKPTPSEIKDARKRFGTIGSMEMEVMGELKDIIPMRRELGALAKTPWDKMQGFYRPSGSDGPH